MVKALNVFASIVFVLCVPVLLITTNVRLAVNDIRLYEYGFNKYNVSTVTKLDDAELIEVAHQIIDYFNSDEELLEVDIFSQREVAHMTDVKGLVRLAYSVQLASLVYIAAYIAISFAIKRRAFWQELAKRLLWGSWATIAILIALGFWALTGFESLFLFFHLVSFTNDLWQLSAGDYMLLMFPQGFFNNAALLIAGASIGEAAIIGGATWGLLVLRRRAKRKEMSG